MCEERVEVGDEDWQLSKDSADAATATTFPSSALYMCLIWFVGGASLERKQKAESKP